jgi:hypothetical protein
MPSGARRVRRFGRFCRSVPLCRRYEFHTRTDREGGYGE